MAMAITEQSTAAVAGFAMLESMVGQAQARAAPLAPVIR
jgi:hypothetical protein